MKGGRTGDPGEGIIIHFRFPQQLSICRIHGVNIGSPITDERRVARPGTCFDAAYADGRAHGGGRLKKPVDAARSGAERIDVAALAADKDTASGDGGCCSSVPARSSLMISTAVVRMWSSTPRMADVLTPQ